MPHYLRVAPEQLPQGRSALLLFIEDDALCAGIIEHRYDGRLSRLVGEQVGGGGLMPAICRLIQRQAADAELFVVLDPAAYWPDAFPSLDAALFKNSADNEAITAL